MPNDPREYGLGDFRVEDAFYNAHMLRYDTLRIFAAPGWEVLPSAFDARSRQWVTPSKDQGTCGSCWAHAAVGTLESRLLKEGYPHFDLSEQQQISCNPAMSGCCGGSGQSLMFYKTNRAWQESDAPYAERGTSCPAILATGFYTIDRTAEALKMSLVSHGPFYLRYDVYDDFYSHWSHAAPGAVYVQRTGARLGGHAVLLIGWNDEKQAWLLKNSWGPTGGPDRDGTFWMAYSGHAIDLGFQGFNLSGIQSVTP